MKFLVFLLPIIMCIRSASAQKAPTSSNDGTTKASSSMFAGDEHINIFSHDSGLTKSDTEDDSGATSTSDGAQQDSGLFLSKASKSSSVGYGNSMSYGYLIEDASEQSSEEYSSKASKSDHSMSYEFVDSLSYRYADSSDESIEHSSKSSKPILNQVCESDASIKRTHLLVSYLVRIVLD